MRVIPKKIYPSPLLEEEEPPIFSTNLMPFSISIKNRAFQQAIKKDSIESFFIEQILKPCQKHNRHLIHDDFSNIQGQECNNWR